MAIIEFSQKDILRNTLVEPGWYICKVDEMDDGKPSADQKSINYTGELVIIRHADNGEVKFAGVPLRLGFNSKAQGFMIPYFKAFGVDIVAGMRVELKSTVGRVLEVFVENNLYKEKMQNNVNHQYRPLSDKNQDAAA